MLAVFTVSVGHGIVLPLLPEFIERLLGAEGAVSRISLHTGFWTGTYTLALFLFAPAWGRLPDRFGRRKAQDVQAMGEQVPMAGGTAMLHVVVDGMMVPG